MDFTLNITHERDIRILQLTDMQVIDANQRRYPDRIDGWKLTEWTPENNEKISIPTFVISFLKPRPILLSSRAT